MKPLRKSVWRVNKKLKIKLPYDLAIPLFGTFVNINQYTRKVSANLFLLQLCSQKLNYRINQDAQQLMNKENTTHTHTHIHSRKYYDIMSFVGKWIEVKIIMLSEISQTQKVKYPMTPLIHGV
jgi:hypothetical protein